MSKHEEIYVIPSGISKRVAETICLELENLPLYTSEVTSGNKNVRNSKVSAIPTDHWISGMMYHFIHCANINSFGYDLHFWSGNVQYTVYDGKQTGYAWHTDNLTSAFDKSHVRKLSMSLCLSSDDDYEGGEFQIMVGAYEMQTFKMNCGDVIVFPSDAMHRVRPLKSGKRISLVGWMGGPKFK